MVLGYRLTHKAASEAAAGQGRRSGDAHEPAVLLGMLVLL